MHDQVLKKKKLAQVQFPFFDQNSYWAKNSLCLPKTLNFNWTQSSSDLIDRLGTFFSLANSSHVEPVVVWSSIAYRQHFKKAENSNFVNYWFYHASNNEKFSMSCHVHLIF